MTDRLTERTIYDSSGMERVPFDGRVPAPSDSRVSHRTATRNHGAGCSSNPEVGCICGYDAGEHPDAELEADPGRPCAPVGQGRCSHCCRNRPVKGEVTTAEPS